MCVDEDLERALEAFVVGVLALNQPPQPYLCVCVCVCVCVCGWVGERDHEDACVCVY